MKVPLNWLREYCSPDLDTAAIEERLTMTGTKVETILHHGAPSSERFVVARVLSVEAHPNADRLRVCEVDVGESTPAGIVCGAPNVAAGQTVAVALPGASMPDGTKIKGAKLRGVPSNGMILAADELEIDSDHSGIMVLDESVAKFELAPGMPLGGVIPTGTDVLELEITPNRPDCLGVYGVARELHAATGAPLASEPWAEDPGSESAAFGDDRSIDAGPVVVGEGDVGGSGPVSNEGDVGGAGPVSSEDDAAGAGPAVSSEDEGGNAGRAVIDEDDAGGAGQTLSQGAAPRARGGHAPVDVTVECFDLCKRFTARTFEGVTIAPSPLWLKARLSAAGQRPINNVVDITNYTMLLTGQPLHAFDLDRIAGGRLTVRRALDGERVSTLDGQARTLDGEMVVIEDADGPTSIAGIMGGERSEVQPATTRVLMEVANWSGPNIHRTSWALGLRSEASGRFEKGLAPEQCMHAQAVATRLMIELCGAKLIPGTIDLAWEPEQPQTIRLRERRVRAILGMDVPLGRQAEILKALDFGVAEVDRSSNGGEVSHAGGQGASQMGGDGASVSRAPYLIETGTPLAEAGLDVTVPPVRRNDVTREADLIEEVARIHGLGELPATLPARRGAYGRLSPIQRLRRRAVDALVGRGLYETVGWTFTAPTLHDRLRLPAEDVRRCAPVLENPLSEDQSLLRTTLLGSLLDVAAYNSARGAADLRLFEMGSLFVLDGESRAPDDGASAAEKAGSQGGNDVREQVGGRGQTGVRERLALAVLLSGRIAPATWGAPDPPKADLFAVKGVLEALGDALRVQLECQPETQPFLHPGRSAAVVSQGRRIGWLGELHPLVAREWDIEGAAVMELELDPLLAIAAGEHAYRDVISYPALRQDLAVVLPHDVPAARALDAVREAAPELLDEVGVFDVYSGPQVGEGKRSLALSLTFRVPDHTLTDEDVEPVRARIVAALAALGGELRG
jgi:phenylalanyl-tRNA synthetase beta chain